MPAVRRTLLAALVLAAVAPATATARASACADADVAVTAATATRAADAVRCLVDVERTTRGLPPLAAEPRLTTAARDFAGAMRAGGFFDHTGPDGSTPATRVTDAGYSWSSVGENIATGQGTAREVMTAWMRSAGHCENVLAPGFTELGVGVVPADRGALWVQDLGRPRGTTAARAHPDLAAACPAAGLTPSAASGGSGGGTGTTTGSASAGSGAGGSDLSSGARALRVGVVRRGRVLRVSGRVSGVRTVKVTVGGRTHTVRVRNGRFAVRVTGRKGTRVTVRAGALRRHTTAR